MFLTFNCTVTYFLPLQIIFDETTVAKKINEFFTPVASILVRNLPKSKSGYDQILVDQYNGDKGVTKNDFRLQIMDESIILCHLQSLYPNKAVGLDRIPSNVLKDSAG